MKEVHRYAWIEFRRRWFWANFTLARRLCLYGLFLILAGVAGFLSNPEKAKTALLSGGTFGGLSVLWGILVAKGFLWARAAALATTIVLILAFAWRAAASWLLVFGGRSEKLFAAFLISLMLTAYVAMLASFRRSSS